MAFYKKIQRKVDGKWYASAVTVGKPVTTDEVADYMANGRTVKMDGLGTFYYTANTQGMARLCANSEMRNRP